MVPRPIGRGKRIPKKATEKETVPEPPNQSPSSDELDGDQSKSSLALSHILDLKLEYQTDSEGGEEGQETAKTHPPVLPTEQDVEQSSGEEGDENPGIIETSSGEETEPEMQPVRPPLKAKKDPPAAKKSSRAVPPQQPKDKDPSSMKRQNEPSNEEEEEDANMSVTSSGEESEPETQLKRPPAKATAKGKKEFPTKKVRAGPHQQLKSKIDTTLKKPVSPLSSSTGEESEPETQLKRPPAKATAKGKKEPPAKKAPQQSKGKVPATLKKPVQPFSSEEEDSSDQEASSEEEASHSKFVGARKPASKATGKGTKQPAAKRGRPAAPPQQPRSKESATVLKKSIGELVIEALEFHDERKGVSVPAIRKYVLESEQNRGRNWKRLAPLVKRAIDCGIEEQRILRSKGYEEMSGLTGRFKVNRSVVMKAKPPKQTTKKVAQPRQPKKQGEAATNETFIVPKKTAKPIPKAAKSAPEAASKGKTGRRKSRSTDMPVGQLRQLQQKKKAAKGSAAKRSQSADDAKGRAKALKTKR